MTATGLRDGVCGSVASARRSPVAVTAPARASACRVSQRWNGDSDGASSTSVPHTETIDGWNCDRPARKP